MTFVRSRSFARAASFAGITLLCACNGNSSPFNGPTPGPCSYQNAKIALISPAPGASGVPDAFPEVIVATSAVFPNTYDAVVTGSIGGVTQQVAFGQFIPASLPSGATPPPFPNPIYYGSTNSGVVFDPKTQVSVALNDVSSSCTPGAPIGTFTVQ